jgi:nucleotide-binding universal stress UspA family protein
MGTWPNQGAGLTIAPRGLSAACRRQAPWVLRLDRCAVEHGWHDRCLRCEASFGFGLREPMSDWLVCGVDDSRGSWDAARCAKAMADRLAARLLLVHVAHVLVVPGASGIPSARHELHDCTVKEAHRLLARVTAEVGCFDAEQRVELGEPVHRLIRVAEEREALLLVIGSRGRGAVRAALLGSVSLGLCRQAPCPVLVIPRGAAIFTASGGNARASAPSAGWPLE